MHTGQVPGILTTSKFMTDQRKIKKQTGATTARPADHELNTNHPPGLPNSKGLRWLRPLSNSVAPEYDVLSCDFSAATSPPLAFGDASYIRPQLHWLSLEHLPRTRSPQP